MTACILACLFVVELELEWLVLTLKAVKQIFSSSTCQAAHCFYSIHLRNDVFANISHDNSKEPLVQPDQQFLFLFAIQAILFVNSLNSCFQNYALYCDAALYRMV